MSLHFLHRLLANCLLLAACLAVSGCFHHNTRESCDSSDSCSAGGDGGLAGLAGGRNGRGRRGGFQPPYDRPFPLGAVTDAHWETQQTNAEAADFIFFDHEFTGDTAALAPGAKKHLESVALRLEHVPFPVVIEQSPHNARPELDRQRRQTVVEQLARLGCENAENRVVIADAFAEGITGVEGERAYSWILGNNFANGGGIGNRFGGRGGFFR